MFYLFFFFNDTATTEIYTLSLHDALPILDGAVVERRRRQDFREGRVVGRRRRDPDLEVLDRVGAGRGVHAADRKSTRLNSSHANISYAVFCLKKKKNHHTNLTHTSSAITR